MGTVWATVAGADTRGSAGAEPRSAGAKQRRGPGEYPGAAPPPVQFVLHLLSLAGLRSPIMSMVLPQTLRSASTGT